MKLTWILVAALHAGALLAEDKPQSCPQCTGTKHVKCFACDGEGRRLPCQRCAGSGKISCISCNGTPQRECNICVGQGVFGEDRDNSRCAACRGAKKCRCAICKDGTLPCPECGGKGVEAWGCFPCGNTGKLACPICSSRDPAAKCDRCKATSQVKCPTCAGSGEALLRCSSCLSMGKRWCNGCACTGRQVCLGCYGTGYRLKANPGDRKEKCKECNVTGWRPCEGCKGTGLAACEPCSGAGGKMQACPTCSGAKSHPCPRCTTVRCWTRKDPTSGATLTMLPCGSLEPSFRPWMASFCFAANPMWRLVVDGREASGPFKLGKGGWYFEASSEDGGRCLSELNPGLGTSFQVSGPEMGADAGRMEIRFRERLARGGMRDDLLHQMGCEVPSGQSCVIPLFGIESLSEPVPRIQYHLDSDRTRIPFEPCDLTLDDWTRRLIEVPRAAKQK